MYEMVDVGRKYPSSMQEFSSNFMILSWCCVLWLVTVRPEIGNSPYTLFPQNYSRCSGGVKKSAFNSLIELKYLDRISSGKQLNNSETCFPKRSNILISNFMSRDIF